MKRYLLLLPAMLLLWGSVSHASLLQNGSFEASAPVSSGFQDPGVWYTDGFDWSTPGAADGDFFASAPDTTGGYQLFQTVQVGWGGSAPTQGSISLNYRLHDGIAQSWGMVSAYVYGSTDLPAAGTDPGSGSFGTYLAAVPLLDRAFMISGTNSDWLAAPYTGSFSIASEYAYYTVHLKGVNADFDSAVLTLNNGAFAVPLPSALLLLGTGLFGLLGVRHRKRIQPYLSPTANPRKPGRRSGPVLSRT